MKRNSGWQALLQNWPVKIIASVMAIFLFFVVNYTTEVRREIDIPLKVTLPQMYDAASSIPATVTLIIIGKDQTVHLIEPSHITAEADFTLVAAEGVASAPVLLSQSDYPISSNIVLKVHPESLKVFFTAKPVATQTDVVDLGGISL